jgi:rubredoxin
MVTFVTIAGIILTAAFFLYALSAVDNQSLDKKEKSRREREDNQRTGDPRKVYSKEWNPNIPRPRICPMCGAMLRKDEFLYAAISAHVNFEGKKQAQIYGCKYCYLIIERGFSDLSKEPERELDL